MRTFQHHKVHVFSLLLITFFLIGFFLQNIGLLIPKSYLNNPENAWNVIDGMYGWLNVSYFDYGVVRRAFIGTILHPLPEPYRYILFILITVLSISSTYFLLVKYAFSVYDDYILKVLLLIFAFSPIGSMNFGWMFGRFEFINYVIIIVSIYLVIREKYLFVTVLLIPIYSMEMASWQ